MSLLEKFKSWKFDMYWKYRNSRLNKLVWAIMHRFHPDHQYNKLHTGLPPGYYDPDTQILYSVMNTFRKYMEHGAEEFVWGNEKREDHPYFTDEEWESYSKQLESHREIKAELDEIYQWWVNRYLKYQDLTDVYWNNTNRDETVTIDSLKELFPDLDARTDHGLFEFEDKLEAEANIMLARLMKYRQTLWYA